MKHRTDQWDHVFREEGEVFTTLQEDMPEIVDLLKKEKVKRVLDLGCGTGRHTVYLAENGFEVCGMDVSPTGIDIARRRLDEKGLQGDLRVGDIYDALPYPDGYFQALISTQVIHHSTIENVRKLIKETERVLAPGGIVFVTVAVGKRGERKEIAPSTFVPVSGREEGLPHYLFTPETLRVEFGGFNVIKVWEEKRGRHYCLLGKRRE